MTATKAQAAALVALLVQVIGQVLTFAVVPSNVRVWMEMVVAVLTTVGAYLGTWHAPANVAKP